MGYACPVCETPQQDGEHLANHLAFTAMLRGDEHAAWLDEHTPGWDEDSPGELADRVTDHAAETEFDAVFEDTSDAHHGDVDLLAGPEPDSRPGGGHVDDDTEAVLEEARALTEGMLGEKGTGDDGDGAGNPDQDADDGGDVDHPDPDDPA